MRSPAPSGTLLDQRFAYVAVTQFASADQDVINGYATTLQRIVKDLDAKEPCGWIVDLRQNGGGNMWPMLAGLGPLLSTGALGSFVGSARNRDTTWSYQNGVAMLGPNAMAQVTDPPYRMNIPTPPIAVLVGGTTASSGEAVAIAFRGNPNTRSFGQRTRGLTTANAPFMLSDHAVINLTTSIDADRVGHAYQDGVTPDELIDDADGEHLPAAARSWLLQQPACASLKARGLVEFVGPGIVRASAELFEA
jgi:C-terminal processing protease CtpA/Prc